MTGVQTCALPIYGNVAMWGDAAPDAADPGLTEGGLEAQLPWSNLFPTGIPSTGLRIAVVAVLYNDDGTWISNQLLPPGPSDVETGGGELAVASVVVVEVDGTGALAGTPWVDF